MRHWRNGRGEGHPRCCTAMFCWDVCFWVRAFRAARWDRHCLLLHPPWIPGSRPVDRDVFLLADAGPLDHAWGRVCQWLSVVEDAPAFGAQEPHAGEHRPPASTPDQLAFFEAPVVGIQFDPWTFHLNSDGEVGGRGAFTAWVVGLPAFGHGGTPEHAVASLAESLKEACSRPALLSSLAAGAWVLTAVQRLDTPALAEWLRSWATEPVRAEDAPRRNVRQRPRPTTNRP